MFESLLCFLSLLPDPSIAIRHEQLIQQLGHRSWRVRERATQELARGDWRVLLSLHSASARAVAERDPEVTWRLAYIGDEIVASWKTARLAELDRRYSGNWPMIDSTWFDLKGKCYDASGAHDSGNADRQASLYWYYSNAKIADGDTRTWAQWREGSRLWFRDMTEGGMPFWFMDLLYQEMHRRDRVWISTLNRVPTAAPITSAP